MHGRHRVVHPVDVDGTCLQAQIAPVAAEVPPDQNALHLEIQRKDSQRRTGGDRGELSTMHGWREHQPPGSGRLAWHDGYDRRIAILTDVREELEPDVVGSVDVELDDRACVVLVAAGNR